MNCPRRVLDTESEQRQATPEFSTGHHIVDTVFVGRLPGGARTDQVQLSSEVFRGLGVGPRAFIARTVRLFNAQPKPAHAIGGEAARGDRR